MKDISGNKSTRPVINKKVEFKLRYRWIESYPNGQTLTTEPHDETFDLVTDYYARITEIRNKKEPCKGMKLEYMGWQITTECIADERQ